MSQSLHSSYEYVGLCTISHFFVRPAALLFHGSFTFLVAPKSSMFYTLCRYSNTDQIAGTGDCRDEYIVADSDESAVLPKIS